jgi:hypothetical protein
MRAKYLDISACVEATDDASMHRRVFNLELGAVQKLHCRVLEHLQPVRIGYNFYMCYPKFSTARMQSIHRES